jgi:hypothetical protein
MQGEMLRITGTPRLGRLPSEPYIAAQVSITALRVGPAELKISDGRHQLVRLLTIKEVCTRLPVSIPNFSRLPE